MNERMNECLDSSVWTCRPPSILHTSFVNTLLRPEQQETALHQVQIDNDLVVVLVPLGSPHLLSHQYLGSGHYSTPSSR